MGGAAALGAMTRGDGGPPPCAGVTAELISVWDPSTRAVLAARRHALASEQLDRYAAQSASARQATCEATHVRGEANEQQLAAGMRCLDDRLAALRGFVAELGRGDVGLVDRAVEAARMLPSIDRCRDERDTPALAPQAVELRRELERVPQLMALHGAAPAKRVIETARPRVAALADPALDAQLRVMSARVLHFDGERTEAAAELRIAIASAERAR
jgi:hypothetical protein